MFFLKSVKPNKQFGNIGDIRLGKRRGDTAAAALQAAPQTTAATTANQPAKETNPTFNIIGCVKTVKLFEDPTPKTDAFKNMK